jgi:hypothetical protein
MNIDHHLQQAILETLAKSEALVRYRDLKEDDIENSLFSYHLNKLIDRHMIEKSNDGYSLSIEGARWLKDNGFALRQKESPRVYVALVIQNEAGEYLVGQRTGQFKEMINDYISPAVPYTDGADIANQIDAAIGAFIPQANLRSRKNFGFAQIKASYNDGAILRSLFHVTRCEVEYFEPLQDNFEWLSREQIEAIVHPSATILIGLIVHVKNDENQNVTPTIAG